MGRGLKREEKRVEKSGEKERGRTSLTGRRGRRRGGMAAPQSSAAGSRHPDREPDSFSGPSSSSSPRPTPQRGCHGHTVRCHPPGEGGKRRAGRRAACRAAWGGWGRRRERGNGAAEPARPRGGRRDCPVFVRPSCSDAGCGVRGAGEQGTVGVRDLHCQAVLLGTFLAASPWHSSGALDETRLLRQLMC